MTNRQEIGVPVPREPKVVICGGGAGGLELAIGLARRHCAGIHLINPSPVHIWKPLLHEVASGSLNINAHEAPYLALARWHGFTFLQGRLEGIERQSRVVLIGSVQDETGAELIPARRLSYDLLVISVGGVTNDFGIPGVHTHACMLDTIEDAEQIHRRILRACMQANYGNESLRERGFRICIIGGGATGVELAAELSATTRTLLAYGLDQLDPERFIHITIVNADPRLVPQLPRRISEAVAATLKTLNIGVRNDQQVMGVEKGHLVTKSGVQIASDLTIWAAGVKAPPFLSGIGNLETNRLGQIVVAPTLQAISDPSIVALGDCAACPWVGHDRDVPPRAQAAHQQATYLRRAIPRLLRGSPIGDFHYNDLGSLISLGEGDAIGTLMGIIGGTGIRIEGLIAGAIYRWLYKCHQASLYGWRAVLLDTLGRWFGSATRPRVKLH